MYSAQDNRSVKSRPVCRQAGIQGVFYMSIKTKLLIFGLSISLIPISIITTLYYFSARSTIERQTLDWLTAVAESKKVHTLSFLDSKKGRVVDFSSDGFIRDSLEIISRRGTQSYAVPSLNRHLKVNKKSLDSHITSIAVLDINGRVVASTTEEWVGKDMSEENIFMSCVSKNYGETYTGKSYNVPYLNVNCIFISAPLTSKQENKTMGVIINAYDIAILDEITTKRAGMGESGEALLGMRSGDSVVFLTTLKYAPDMPLSKSVPLDSSGAELMRLALKGLGGAIIAPDYRGIDVVAAYQYIPNMDWGLVTKIDKEEVFAPIARIRNFTIILGSISTVVVITIVILLSKRVTRPIQKLVEGTRRIASGDLDFKIIARSKDEVGYLADSFNDMTSQLGESKKQLQDYTLNLEKKVEERTKEIKKGKEYTGKLIETAQDAIICIDEKGIINIWNKSAEIIFGYSESEIIGQSVTTIIPERYKKRYQEGLNRFSKTGEARIMGKTVEIFGKTKGGIEIPIELSLSFHKTEEERYSFTGIIRDLTKRKKSEEEIKSLAKFPSENPNPVLRVERNGTILFANNAGSIFLDYWGAQIGQALPEDWHKRVLDVLRSGTSNNYEMKCNDHIFSIELAPVIEEGYVNFYALDITERKKMEETLLQSEKLRAMGMMTSGVAHDFNNILAVISGNAQLMERNYGDSVPPRCHKEMMDGLHIIRKAVSDGAEIVKRMRKFTKVERDTSEFVSVDIKEILEQAIEFSRPRWMNMARARGITYDIDKEGFKEVPTVLGSPSELREVFVNIINNALDAMTGGGCITFRTWHRSGESRGSRGESPPRKSRLPRQGGAYLGGSSHQSLLGRGTLSKEDTAFMSISDTGEGMTEEVRKRVFDPFFTTKRAERSGLGMSVAYSIITGHGGKIEVESEAGKGTTFTMSIPITREAPQQAVSPEPPWKIKAKKLRILAIDDEEEICSVLNKYFSRDGHDIKSVNNGTEAIKLLKNEEFGLVLCDLVLPDMSGHDVVKVINELDKRPKVGLITGWDEKIETKSREELKVDFIIRKPFDFSKLANHINEALNAG